MEYQIIALGFFFISALLTLATIALLVAGRKMDNDRIKLHQARATEASLKSSLTKLRTKSAVDLETIRQLRKDAATHKRNADQLRTALASRDDMIDRQKDKIRELETRVAVLCEKLGIEAE